MLTTDGWFLEKSSLWPGQALALKVEEVLLEEQTGFQSLLVFRSESHGNVLVLDGVVQATERDEFAYQEAITHIPLCSHPNPKKVLVIGGGDGGVLREVVKHECVESVTLVEIDAHVIEAAKKYMPKMAVGFQHPKVSVIVGDGFKYLKDHQSEFDVIITDSSDPEGPAASLFQKEFFELMKNALRPGGMVCTQGESIWLHLKLIQSVIGFARSLFPTVRYAAASVPTYPSGQIGFVVCSLDANHDVTTPVRRPREGSVEYWSEEVHRAMFVLPKFAEKALAASS